MSSIYHLHVSLGPGNLPEGGLPRNSVDKIIDRPDVTSDVFRGRKASTLNKRVGCKGA